MESKKQIKLAKPINVAKTLSYTFSTASKDDVSREKYKNLSKTLGLFENDLANLIKDSNTEYKRVLLREVEDLLKNIKLLTSNSLSELNDLLKDKISNSLNSLAKSIPSASKLRTILLELDNIEGEGYQLVQALANKSAKLKGAISSPTLKSSKNNLSIYKNILGNLISVNSEKITKDLNSQLKSLENSITKSINKIIKSSNGKSDDANLKLNLGKFNSNADKIIDQINIILGNTNKSKSKSRQRLGGLPDSDKITIVKQTSNDTLKKAIKSTTIAKELSEESKKLLSPNYLTFLTFLLSPSGMFFTGFITGLFKDSFISAFNNITQSVNSLINSAILFSTIFTNYMGITVDDVTLRLKHINKTAEQKTKYFINQKDTIQERVEEISKSAQDHYKNIIDKIKNSDYTKLILDIFITIYGTKIQNLVLSQLIGETLGRSLYKYNFQPPKSYEAATKSKISSNKTTNKLSKFTKAGKAFSKISGVAGKFFLPLEIMVEGTRLFAGYLDFVWADAANRRKAELAKAERQRKLDEEQFNRSKQLELERRAESQSLMVKDRAGYYKNATKHYIKSFKDDIVNPADRGRYKDNKGKVIGFNNASFNYAVHAKNVLAKMNSIASFNNDLPEGTNIISEMALEPFVNPLFSSHPEISKIMFLRLFNFENDAKRQQMSRYFDEYRNYYMKAGISWTSFAMLSNPQQVSNSFVSDRQYGLLFRSNRLTNRVNAYSDFSNIDDDDDSSTAKYISTDGSEKNLFEYAENVFSNGSANLETIYDMYTALSIVGDSKPDIVGPLFSALFLTREINNGQMSLEYDKTTGLYVNRYLANYDYLAALSGYGVNGGLSTTIFFEKSLLARNNIPDELVLDGLDGKYTFETKPGNKLTFVILKPEALAKIRDADMKYVRFGAGLGTYLTDERIGTHQMDKDKHDGTTIRKSQTKSAIESFLQYAEYTKTGIKNKESNQANKIFRGNAIRVYGDFLRGPRQNPKDSKEVGNWNAAVPTTFGYTVTGSEEEKRNFEEAQKTWSADAIYSQMDGYGVSEFDVVTYLGEYEIEDYRGGGGMGITNGAPVFNTSPTGWKVLGGAGGYSPTGKATKMTVLDFHNIIDINFDPTPVNSYDYNTNKALWEILSRNDYWNKLLIGYQFSLEELRPYTYTSRNHSDTGSPISVTVSNRKISNMRIDYNGTKISENQAWPWVNAITITTISGLFNAYVRYNETIYRVLPTGYLNTPNIFGTHTYTEQWLMGYQATYEDKNYLVNNHFKAKEDKNAGYRCSFVVQKVAFLDAIYKKMDSSKDSIGEFESLNEEGLTKSDDQLIQNYLLNTKCQALDDALNEASIIVNNLNGKNPSEQEEILKFAIDKLISAEAGGLAAMSQLKDGEDKTKLNNKLKEITNSNFRKDIEQKYNELRSTRLSQMSDYIIFGAAYNQDAEANTSKKNKIYWNISNY